MKTKDLKVQEPYKTVAVKSQLCLEVEQRKRLGGWTKRVLVLMKSVLYTYRTKGEGGSVNAWMIEGAEVRVKRSTGDGRHILFFSRPHSYKVIFAIGNPYEQARLLHDLSKSGAVIMGLEGICLLKNFRILQEKQNNARFAERKMEAVQPRARKLPALPKLSTRMTNMSWSFQDKLDSCTRESFVNSQSCSDIPSSFVSNPLYNSELDLRADSSYINVGKILRDNSLPDLTQESHTYENCSKLCDVPKLIFANISENTYVNTSNVNTNLGVESSHSCSNNNNLDTCSDCFSSTPFYSKETERLKMTDNKCYFNDILNQTTTKEYVNESNPSHYTTVDYFSDISDKAINDPYTHVPNRPIAFNIHAKNGTQTSRVESQNLRPRAVITTVSESDSDFAINVEKKETEIMHGKEGNDMDLVTSTTESYVEDNVSFPFEQYQNAQSDKIPACPLNKEYLEVLQPTNLVPKMQLIELEEMANAINELEQNIYINQALISSTSNVNVEILSNNSSAADDVDEVTLNDPKERSSCNENSIEDFNQTWEVNDVKNIDDENKLDVVSHLKEELLLSDVIGVRHRVGGPIHQRNVELINGQIIFHGLRGTPSEVSKSGHSRVPEWYILTARINLEGVSVSPVLGNGTDSLTLRKGSKCLRVLEFDTREKLMKWIHAISDEVLRVTPKTNINLLTLYPTLPPNIKPNLKSTSLNRTKPNYNMYEDVQLVSTKKSTLDESSTASNDKNLETQSQSDLVIELANNQVKRSSPICLFNRETITKSTTNKEDAVDDMDGLLVVSVKDPSESSKSSVIPEAPFVSTFKNELSLAEKRLSGNNDRCGSEDNMTLHLTKETFPDTSPNSKNDFTNFEALQGEKKFFDVCDLANIKNTEASDTVQSNVEFCVKKKKDSDSVMVLSNEKEAIKQPLLVPHKNDKANEITDTQNKPKSTNSSPELMSAPLKDNAIISPLDCSNQTKNHKSEEISGSKQTSSNPIFSNINILKNSDANSFPVKKNIKTKNALSSCDRKSENNCPNNFANTIDQSYVKNVIKNFNQLIEANDSTKYNKIYSNQNNKNKNKCSNYVQLKLYSNVRNFPSGNPSVKGKVLTFDPNYSCQIKSENTYFKSTYPKTLLTDYKPWKTIYPHSNGNTERKNTVYPSIYNINSGKQTFTKPPTLIKLTNDTKIYNKNLENGDKIEIYKQENKNEIVCNEINSESQKCVKDMDKIALDSYHGSKSLTSDTESNVNTDYEVNDDIVTVKFINDFEEYINRNKKFNENDESIKDEKIQNLICDREKNPNSEKLDESFKNVLREDVKLKDQNKELQSDSVEAVKASNDKNNESKSSDHVRTLKKELLNRPNCSSLNIIISEVEITDRIKEPNDANGCNEDLIDEFNEQNSLLREAPNDEDPSRISWSVATIREKFEILSTVTGENYSRKSFINRNSIRQRKVNRNSIKRKKTLESVSRRASFKRNSKKHISSFGKVSLGLDLQNYETNLNHMYLNNLERRKCTSMSYKGFNVNIKERRKIFEQDKRYEREKMHIQNNKSVMILREGTSKGDENTNDKNGSVSKYRMNFCPSNSQIGRHHYCTSDLASLKEGNAITIWEEANMQQKAEHHHILNNMSNTFLAKRHLIAKEIALMKIQDSIVHLEERIWTIHAQMNALSDAAGELPPLSTPKDKTNLESLKQELEVAKVQNEVLEASLNKAKIDVILARDKMNSFAQKSLQRWSDTEDEGLEEKGEGKTKREEKEEEES